MVEPDRYEIADVARLTGVSVANLRAWERRHGFPRPARGPGGRRRYGIDDVTRVRDVLAARRSGLSVAAAIERVHAAPRERLPSVFAAVRRTDPGAPVMRLGRRAMLALSGAVEDEVAARGRCAVLVGCFQRERAYRRVERRWRDLARTADLALALADFPRARAPRQGPREVPLDDGDPALREWAVVAAGQGIWCALTGWEPPTTDPPRPGERRLEVVWTADPCAVGAAVQAALSRMPESERRPGAPGDLPRPGADDQAAGLRSLTGRMIAALAAPAST